MRVGVDVMGGDYAPEAAVMGVLEASKIVSQDTIIVMFGRKDEIEAILSNQSLQPSNVEIVNTTEVIEMSDSPTQAFQKKRDSSIVVGFNYLQEGKIDAFASAGSTGAMFVGCMYTVKQIEGIIRPTIAAPLPTVMGKDILLLDVGLNVDCKPEVLYQYGIIGSIYSKVMMGIENPRVSLLNIGEEDEKGNIQTKATYNLMKDTKDFNFVGNLESKYILEGTKADVLVCDGFIGNTVLKMAEGFYSVLGNCVSGDKIDFYNRLNYEVHGGTPVLGVNEVVIIGHGCSSPLAISNMILQTEMAVKGGLIQKIKEAFC